MCEYFYIQLSPLRRHQKC